MQQLEDAVLAAADHLVDAFSSHDRERYFAAFAPEATFIFHNLDRVLKNRAEYEAEWQLWESRDGFRVKGCLSSGRNVQIAGTLSKTAGSFQIDHPLDPERRWLSHSFRKTKSGCCFRRVSS